MTRISAWTCFLLVTLRMCIGWHFLVEGGHKYHTHEVGKTATNTPWSGEGFFREGYGPVAQMARNFIGDPDQLALEVLKPVNDQFPPALASEWQKTIEGFANHYGLSAEQRTRAETILADAKLKTLNWLKSGVIEVKKTFPTGTVDQKMTVPQRVAEYEAKLREYQEVMTVKLPAFNQDVEKLRLRTLKGDGAKIRADLLADLDGQFDTLVRKPLQGLLTPEQAQKPAYVESKPAGMIDLLDKITYWTFIVLGLFLIVGLFSRTACLLLAGFLLMVTLITPALPYAPTPPGAIGYYLYINLYVIELIALLALASMPTGRWFGLDAFLDHIPPFRRREPRVAVAPMTPAAAGRARR